MSKPYTDKRKNLAKALDDKSLKVTEEEWGAFHLDLLRFFEHASHGWYASCFGQMKRILTKAIPTACVGFKDGELFFAANPNMLKQLTFSQRCMIYCHEIEHIIRSHLIIMEDFPERATRYNIIADSLINEALIGMNKEWNDKNLPTWKDDPNDPNGQVHELITKQMLIDMINDAVRGGASVDYPFPNMTRDKFVQDFSVESLYQYLPKNPEDDGSNVMKDIFEDMINGLYGENGEFFDDGSIPHELKESMVEEMVNEATQSRGYAPSHLQRYVDKLKDKTNRDWRMMLRGLGRSTKISTTSSWMKWNKKTPGIRPGRYVKSYPKVLVMGDTSGSIGSAELTGLIKELNGLLQKCMIDLAWVDARFDPENKEQFFKDIKNVNDFHRRAATPYGGGGTFFKEFYEYALEHYGEYQHIMIFTDGYADHIPKRLVPGQQLALMTPIHDKEWADAAKELGFKVAVVEDV